MRQIGAMVVGLVVLMLLAYPDPASAQPEVVVGGQGPLRLELSALPRPGGQRLTGYVYNGYDSRIGQISLLVEGLTATGEVTVQSVAYVQGDIPGGSRTYVSASIPPASSYRVRVLAYDFTNCRD